MKYTRKEAIEFISKHLIIPMPQAYTQDWEWEMADADRLDEFINFYLNNCLEDHVKIILMELIISSFDDKINQGNDCSSDWNRIKTILKDNLLLHRETIEYWARRESKDEDECFAVTKYIRQLLPK